MVGLHGHRPDLTDYHECIKVIEDHVKRYTVDELEEMNWRIKQAGRYPVRNSYTISPTYSSQA